MKSIRKWIRDIFGFSGTEINGFLILLPVTLLLVFSEPVYHAWTSAQTRLEPQDVSQLDSLVSIWELQKKKPASQFVRDTLFSFDPNTATIEELRRLGFSERSSNRIAAYRLKGGVFTVKRDLMKIYDLDSTLYNQLYKYIRLPSSRLILMEPGKPRERPGTEASERKQEKNTIDINTADTTLFKTVYGIGPRLAARIVKFRDGLGGFIYGHQLYEVYGLDSAVVERLLKVGIITSDFVPVKININAVDEERLARHPYIRYKIARALTSYRHQHGDFQQVSDIKKLSAINTQDLERLLPYIKVKD